MAPSQTSGQYLHGSKDLRLQSEPLTPPAPNEVQVAIRSTTLCGSDLHYYSHYRNGSILVREPLCLGHESAGQVIALGSNAAQINLKVGDSVALEVGVPCGDCSFCADGRYNICPDLRFRSSGSKFPHHQGTLQEYMNHPYQWVHKLPAELDCEIGALLEPLSVAVHGVRRLGDTKKLGQSSCLIFGAGAVGLLCAVAMQAEGCRNIVMADIDQGRLQFALENGFTSTIYKVEPKRGASIEEKLAIAAETAAGIAQLKWPNGEPIGQVHTTIECTGVESCVQSSIYSTRGGGKVLLVGMGTPNHTLPISHAFAKEIDLISTWRYANTYPKAIEIAVASVTGSAVNGVTLPNIQKLITHRFEGLDSVQAGIETAGKTADGEGRLVVKTVINFS